MRDHFLDYLRALSLRYFNRHGGAKAHLSRLIVFEAARRMLETVEGNMAQLSEFELTLKVMTKLERGANGNNEWSRLLTWAGTEGSIEPLRRGYEDMDSYTWLREKGSIEAHYEAQTFLPHEIQQKFTSMLISQP